MVITYHEKQSEREPAKDWFTFTPQKFHLKPGEVKNVQVALTLPLQVNPEKYFAYLEAHPLRKSAGDGGTQVGVAAAAKLYFSVKPANIIQAIFYRISSLYAQYRQVVWFIIGAGIFYTMLKIARRFIQFDIQLKKPTHPKHDNEKHQKPASD